MDNTAHRFAIKITRPDGDWFIFRLNPMTSPSWTGSPSAAKTWASPAGAKRAARSYALPADAEFVAVAR